MIIKYTQNTLPIYTSSFLYPLVNVTTGNVAKKYGERKYIDTGVSIRSPVSLKAVYFDIFAFNSTENRLLYEVYQMHRITPNGGEMQKVFQCYWQLGTRVRTETGEQSYEYWQHTAKVNRHKLAAENMICSPSEFCLLMQRKSIVVHASSWPEIVKEWEKGTIQTSVPGWRKRGFGCEFEFTGITRNQAVNALMNTGHFKNCHYEGGSLHKHYLYDLKGRKFEIVRDSSIKTSREECQVEFVTAVLYYNDLKMLEDCLNALVHAGGRVNKSCGMHVHVTADDYTKGYMFRNLELWSAGYQPLFYKAFAVPKERQKYCKVSSEHLLNRYEQNPRLSMGTVADIQYEIDSNRSSHYNTSRYTIVNLHSFFQGKGIEIRLFNGTLDYRNAKANIIFSCALVQYAASSRILANRDYISHRDEKKAMLFLLEEMDCRDKYLKEMIDGNMH